MIERRGCLDPVSYSAAIRPEEPLMVDQIGNTAMDSGSEHETE